MGLSPQRRVGVRAVYVAAAALLFVVAAACGGGADSPTSVTAEPTSVSSGSSAPPSTTPADGVGSPTPTATPRPPTATPRPTRDAADDLALFFAEARLADGRLRAAAALVNEDVGTEQVVHFREATVAAVRAIRAAAVAQAIPAGLPPKLFRAVLLVYSDVADRSAAFHRVSHGPVDRTDLLGCLRNGHVPATRFPGDLEAAQRLAAATPAVDVPPPDSRAAAEVALHVIYIVKLYGGCDNCGGPVATEPPAVVWKANPSIAPGSPATDGTIGGIRFWAKYQAGRGWDVGILAC